MMALDAVTGVFVVESNLGLEIRKEQISIKVSYYGFGSRLKEEEWGKSSIFTPRPLVLKIFHLVS